MTVPDGLVLIDKPAGITSHDVVARLRRLLGTRRVGHAGTLDPMATGLLVVGVNRATRLLGHLSGTSKEYAAGIRLGVSTTSDDADGEILAVVRAEHVDEAALASAVASLTGDLEQVPCQVSAVKVDGQRAYARARAGETLALAPRRIHVERFALLGRRVAASGDALDLDVEIACSSGTYVRALARDLGHSLGVGGHLTRLRRTRVGPFEVADAVALDGLTEGQVPVLPLAAAAAAAFPQWEVDAERATQVAHGVPLPATGMGDAPFAVFGPDGRFLALLRDEGALARPVAVFAGDPRR